MDAPMNPNMPRRASSGTGFVIATVILLAVIVAGAVYFWRARSASPANDAALQSLNQQSGSDEAAAIQADVNATNVDNVDYDLTPSNFTAS